jgi:hypothetical protein
VSILGISSRDSFEASHPTSLQVMTQALRARRHDGPNPKIQLDRAAADAHGAEGRPE